MPVNFLTVAPGQWFEFALAPVQGRGRGQIFPEEPELLQKTLAILGAGKTAVGYGVFEEFQDKTEEVLAPLRKKEEELRLAKLSPVERQVRQLEMDLAEGESVDKIKQASMDLFWSIDNLAAGGEGASRQGPQEDLGCHRRVGG